MRGTFSFVIVISLLVGGVLARRSQQAQQVNEDVAKGVERRTLRVIDRERVFHLYRPANMPPILLLWGEQNPVLQCEAGKALRDRLRPQTFVSFPNCKHMAMLEDPESFNSAMESFLAK